MTFREKLMKEHPEKVDDTYPAGVVECPCDYGYEDEPSLDRDGNCARVSGCVACWNREMPEDDWTEVFEKALKEDGMVGNHASTIKDSGERTTFSTGAERDMHKGKGDMASIPWEAILRLSKHYENGAAKYKRWNFRKGIPVSSFIDSACRHLAKYQCGCDDEDHLAAAAFNVLGAMLMENTMPEMQDLPLREGKNTFGYFETTV